MYARPDTEAELMAALQEIGRDGGSIDSAASASTFGGAPEREDDGTGSRSDRGDGDPRGRLAVDDES